MYKVECVEKSPEGFHMQNPSGQYVLYVLDSIDRNKKSERRPHRNEVRISQLWWSIFFKTAVSLLSIERYTRIPDFPFDLGIRLDLRDIDQIHWNL